MENQKSWDEKFTNWKKLYLDLQTSDPDFKSLTSAWLQKSVDHKYSYQFEWLGIPIIQYPTDLVIFQEIVWETKPELIIETGVARGGSINFWASIQDICKIKGHVLGIDIEIRDHAINAINKSVYKDSITLIQGSSIDENIIDQVKQIARNFNRVMVVLDSNHEHDHVYKELEIYAELVTKGCYLLVLDTVIDDLDTDPDRSWGPGRSPKSAVLKYMEDKKDRFKLDVDLENRAVLSVAPSGFWLKNS
jgi:cephalosporin hydroxylase